MPHTQFSSWRTKLRFRVHLMCASIHAGLRNKAYFDRILSIIDGNKTKPGAEPRPPDPPGVTLLVTVPVPRPIVPFSFMSTPVRNIPSSEEACVVFCRQSLFAVEGTESCVLVPESERLRNASTMSRLRQVWSGPSSKVGHFLRESSMSTYGK